MLNIPEISLHAYKIAILFWLDEIKIDSVSPKIRRLLSNKILRVHWNIINGDFSSDALLEIENTIEVVKHSHKAMYSKYESS